MHERAMLHYAAIEKLHVPDEVQNASLSMGSKGRMPPPPHLRRSIPPGPAVMPHQLVAPFDLLPPPQVMEQKLASQHAEMQRLATENQRLAATHGALRQELAAAQHELQMLHAHVAALKGDREQQVRVQLEKISKIESEAQNAEGVKLELQQSRGEAQNLVLARDELVSKAQHLTQELQRVHTDVVQIPALISELECLRQEYQHCRATFDYEKKLYNDHLESLQVMEKNYVSMSREVEKLRAELSNTANVDRRNSGPYGGTSGTNDNEASGLPVGQNAYEDGYSVMQQGRGPLPAASGGGGSATTLASTGVQPGSTPAGTGYDPPRGPSYGSSAGPNYDTQRSVTYDTQRLTGYDAFRGSTYDSKRGAIFDAQRTSYDPQRGSGYDMQRGTGYDSSRAGGYDTQSRGVGGPHGHAPPVNNIPYGSTTPPARSGGGYEATRGVNSGRR
ncbi:protein FLX-like 2 isoform X4 [Vigna angularis]|uniref:protein FLX-like 2 isoform X4 n=1 Tax=Phaseolus angularis TaxID=3914 RepID=UPI000809A724|nr:protein FLX-like 2 isoform X4 [Vigna angularis]